MNRELHRLAARKQLLLAELQLQRMQMSLYASDARAALRQLEGAYALAMSRANIAVCPPSE